MMGVVGAVDVTGRRVGTRGGEATVGLVVVVAVVSGRGGRAVL